MQQTVQLNTVFTNATVDPASQPHDNTNLFTLKKLFSSILSSPAWYLVAYERMY